MDRDTERAVTTAPAASPGQAPLGGPSQPRLTDVWRLGPAEVVCAVGAGGKTTLLERLASDYEAEGQRVVLTTTTRVWPPGDGGRPLVLADTEEELLALLGSPPDRSPFVGRRLDEAGKLDGVPPEWVPALRDLPWAAAVLIEADGSKGLPLKAPAAWEPVVPQCASLVVAVAGLDAQGVALDAVHVHRPELLASLLGLPLGSPIPPESLLRAVLAGYLPAVPRLARMYVWLNKADAVPAAPALLEACAGSPVEVWAGSLGGEAGLPAPIRLDLPGTSEGATPTAGVDRGSRDAPDVLVLAAGSATRMGGGKLWASLGERTVIGRVVRTATSHPGIGRVVVVAGRERERLEAVLRRECPDGRYQLATNPAPEAGMSSSLQVGVAALYGRGGVGTGRARDLLVLLADQPFVSGATIDRILQVRASHPRAAAVGLGVDGDVRPPVLMHPSLLPLLAGLSGDKGARNLLRRFAECVVAVRAVDGEGLDVDTPADLEKARQQLAVSVAPDEGRG